MSDFLWDVAFLMALGPFLIPILIIDWWRNR